MKKPRIGVIGVGYLGKFHAEKFSSMETAELVCVVDNNQDSAELIAKKNNTTPYFNYRDIFGKVDAVSIATPTSFHYTIAKEFLENNIDVFIEKPITTTIEEADDLIHLAKIKKKIIQVGHLERFNPAVVALKDIVKKPLFIESHRLGIYKDRGTDVSVVLDLMIHDIDIISNFVKSDIKNISAAGIPAVSDEVDIANARIEFINGCVANVTASRISFKNQRKIRMFQKDAYISVDFANYEIFLVKPNGNKDSGGIIPGMDILQFNFGKGDALDDELKDFVRCVDKRENPLVSGEVGRNALNIALNIMEQINNSIALLLKDE